jgi:hypothetical protein
LTHASLSVQNLLSSQVVAAGSGTHEVPLQVLHVGHSAAVPVPVGLPPQCHPDFKTPTPRLERITNPSSLTTPVPTATND